MPVYAALDVSKASTQVHLVDETGTCLWRGKSLTHPEALAEALGAETVVACPAFPGAGGDPTDALGEPGADP